MAVPKFFEFFEAFLKSLKDGELHTAKEVRVKIAEDMHLSEDDLAELVPSGRQTTFGNRVNWARTYLNKAGLIETAGTAGVFSVCSSFFSACAFTVCSGSF